jgi:hypothetical protein
VYDVAGNLKLYHSSKETKESISTAVGDTESEAIFPTYSSENIPRKRRRKICHTAEQCAPTKHETEQSQRIATQQWQKCQPECQIKNNTTNKIVQVPDILLGKGVNVFKEFMPEEVINLIMGQSILYVNQKNCAHFSPNQEKLKAYLAILVLYG